MMPIIDMLLKHAKKERLSLHMPGHKAGMLFSADHNFLNEEYTSFLKSLSEIARYDLTELIGIDSLHNPKNAILKAMELTAEVYGAASSFFLVNGSTCGVHAMVYSSFRRGDTVLVTSDCHMSVFNALMVLGCRVVIVPVEVDKSTLIPLSVAPKKVEEAYREFPHAKGIILPRPNYYGVCADLKSIADIVHSKEGVVLVDEAHGGHFGFSSKVPDRALSLGADMCVQSAHKTLQSINQGAYLHIADKKYEKKVFKALKVIETTSPSFLVLATLDFTREYMRNVSRERLNGLSNAVNEFTKDLEKYELYHVFDGSGYEKDITRLVINCNGKGAKLAKMLADKGIYCEMYNHNNVVFILTCADDKGSLDILYEGLTSEDLYGSLQGVEEIQSLNHKNTIRDINLFDFDFYMNAESVSMEVKEAVGKVSSQFVIPYPPGIPVIFPGERVTKFHADICQSYCIEMINVIK